MSTSCDVVVCVSENGEICVLGAVSAFSSLVGTSDASCCILVVSAIEGEAHVSLAWVAVGSGDVGASAVGSAREQL